MSTAHKLAKIHVVDDDELFCSAITRLLRVLGYEVRCYPCAGDFLLAQIDDAPGCILLDVYMPGSSGLELQAILAEREMPLPIIFLSGRGDIPAAVQAIKRGAVDFLTKPIDREALVKAITNALAYYQVKTQSRECLTASRDRYLSLSKRELDVLSGVIAGKRNKQIAGDLNIAERTVKAHRAQVMEKMGARSLAELVHISDRLDAAGVVPRYLPSTA